MRQECGTCLVALLLLLCSNGADRPVNAQARLEQAARQTETDIKPMNCERHLLVLEGAHQAAGKDGLIILIARLGNGEYRQELSRHRLHSASAYLTDYVRVRSPESIITAEGQRVNGYGRIELYVGGKLFYVLALRRNAELSVGSCEPEELDDPRQRELRKKLYPWRYKNRGR